MSDSGSSRSRSNSDGGSYSESDDELPPATLTRVSSYGGASSAARGSDSGDEGYSPQQQQQQQQPQQQQQLQQGNYGQQHAAAAAPDAAAASAANAYDSGSEPEDEDAGADPLLTADRELTFEELAVLSRDSAARRRAHKRARVQLKAFLAEHPLPRQLQGVMVHSLGKVSSCALCASTASLPAYLHAPALRSIRIWLFFHVQWF
jgi:hypothetical protein